MTQPPDNPNHELEDSTPDRSVRPDDPTTDNKGADIVDLDAARSGRNVDRSPSDPKPTKEDADGPVIEGEILRVDRPGPARTDWRASLERKATSRQPLIPLWLRSRAEAIETLRWASLHYAHVASYQVLRAPLYAGRLTIRAPRGFVRLVGRLVRWTFDLEGEPVRVAAVQKSDYDGYLKLSRQRDSRVRLRVWITGATLVTLLVVALIVAGQPTSAQWVALAVALAALGILGKPADRPLINRAVMASEVEKLTSDIVVRALSVLGIAGITQALSKNPKDAIRFVAPITR
ncbi:hypothetical protein AB0B64_60340, partial [Nonomuraea sp. NPDC049129]